MTDGYPDRISKICLLSSLIALSSLLVKAWNDFDPNWDSWYYHLPYAGRLWGIIPAEAYRMERDLEHYYQGFPKLGEWLQGLLWRASGRLRAANLVCLLGLAAYALFLRARFGVPFGLGVVSLLAVPLVHLHATSCYVDLPGNLALSALILLTWQLFERQEFHRRRDILPLVLSAFIAANYKFQLIPVVFLFLLIAGARIIWIIGPRRLPRLIGSRGGIVRLTIGAIGVVAIFFVPIKNTIFHGNPFYPIHLAIGPIVLNHRVPLRLTTPAYLRDSLPPERWLMSVLEVNRPFGGWQIGQLYLPVDSPANRMGGYFGAYVVAQVVVLAWLCLRGRSAAIDVSVPVFAAISLLASWLPQAHELRYYMFWMIVLVSMNLINLRQSERLRWSRIALPLINLAALMAVILITKGYYTLPQGITFERLPAHLKRLEPFPWVPSELDRRLLEGLTPGREICVAGQQPITFMYASYFHPPKSYRVVATVNDQSCE